MNCANHPDRERVSFCQNCGKPLCSECARLIGSAVFCEQCLAARLAAADAATSSQGTPYGSVKMPPSYGAPAPHVPGAPNPYLAGILGFIPGVGAMYNGQYAKGVVHLVVFAVFISLVDYSGIFGLFIAGWVCYQVIEAYHTARARRDGTQLPNPFGLNDIGDRFGFGKSWPTSTEGATQTPPVSTPYTAPPAYTPPAAAWSAPSSDYGYTAPPVPPNPAFVDSSAAYAQVPADSSFTPQTNRFPTGAIVLIGLGLLFFFGSSGVFHHFPIQRIIPLLLIALGVWLFVRKMTSTGTGLSDDGSPAYQIRLFQALRGAIWVILVGVLFFLDTFNILSWGHSWPLFIIVAGLMTVFERSAYSSARAAASYSHPYSAPVPPASTSTVSSTTSIVPATPRDDEGR